MKLFADTNWLIPSYIQSFERSPIVARFQRRHGQPLTVAPPVLSESRIAMAALSRTANGTGWQKLVADIGDRLVLETTWESIEAEAAALADRYAPKGAIGTLDMFVLAAAKQSGSTHFLSFDTKTSLRAIAALEKFNVFPDLEAADKERMARFR